MFNTNWNSFNNIKFLYKKFEKKEEENLKKRYKLWFHIFWKVIKIFLWLIKINDTNKNKNISNRYFKIIYKIYFKYA